MLPILWLLVCTLGLRQVDAQGQRVAPGVPPQHYQQYEVHQQVPQQHVQQQQQYQPHQQQFQQMPQQQIPQQQIPQQQIPQQQIPQQQIPQQQIPQQQIPQQQIHQQAHHQNQHGHHHTRGNLLKPDNLAQETEHMQEHLKAPIDPSRMDEHQLQYHYFKMHDADNNNKLDGCELIKSLIHWHAEQGAEGKEHAHDATPDKLFSDEELENLIDPIFQMDDTNKDGYIDYPEFVQAQKKSADQGRQ